MKKFIKYAVKNTKSIKGGKKVPKRYPSGSYDCAITFSNDNNYETD